MDVVAKQCEIESDTGKKIYYQTFKGHVYDSLKILKCYYEKNEQSILSFSRQWNVEPTHLMRNLFVTIYLHDIGKLTCQFQERIQQNKRSQKYPHPFFGFPIAFEIFKTRIPSIHFVENHPVIEPLTVLSHHTQLYDTIYLNAEIKRVYPLQKEIVDFLNHIPESYHALGFERFFELTWHTDEPLLSIDILKLESAREKINSYLHPSGKSMSVKDKIQAIRTLDEMTKIKSIFTFFLSITKLCDFYSSAHFSDFCRRQPDQKVLDSVIETPEDYVLTLPALSSPCILKNNAPYDFQSAIQEEPAPFSFLFAPCGRGKTEAALLWALQISKKFHKNKIVFAMPTQTTSNAIMDRFIEILNHAGYNGKEFVGLYHGKSSIKLKNVLMLESDVLKKLCRGGITYEELKKAFPDSSLSQVLISLENQKLVENRGGTLVITENGKKKIEKGKEIALKEELIEKRDDESELDEEETKEVKSEEFKGNVFYKPITVTTVDHLILSFVHGFPQADFACGNLQNAVIIFDEIHYYETQTLKHLVDLFAVLRKMGVPHLLMSGTLPTFIKNRLKKDSAQEGVAYSEICDSEGLAFTPFKIQSFDYPLIEKGNVDDEIIQEIKKNYSQNLNQFIILNTVRRAQQFYAAIKKEIDTRSVYLVHSQFTYADRMKREEKLIKVLEKERPLIVVSTQVIEISLDISCDIMYTERAPIDSLGQRAGRLNRKGKYWKNTHEFIMNVHPPENHLPYEENILEETKGHLCDGIHSYGSLKEVCDTVYGDEYLEEFEEKGKFEGSYCFLKLGGRRSLFKECFLFGPKFNTIAYSEEEGNRFVIRTENYKKFDVIPETCYKNEEKNLTVENQVKVPYWWIMLDRGMHGDELQWFEPVEKQFKWKKRLYWICKLPYTSDYGFDSSMLEKENERVGLIENIL